MGVFVESDAGFTPQRVGLEVTRVHHFVFAIILALLAAACSRSDGDRIGTAEIDTLPGGRIEVRHANGGAWDAETAWRLEEDLRLGTATGEGPEQFAEIRDVRSDSRGRIYVLNGASNEARVFHPDGTHVHTIGGEGEGPGEFSFPMGMALTPGDTLWVTDIGAGRYSAFGPSGTFLRSHPRRDILGYERYAPNFLSDGSYLDWKVTTPGGRFGPRVIHEPIRFAPEFANRESLPPLEHQRKMLPGGRTAQIFFSGRLEISVDRSGGIWFAHTDEYRIFRRSLQGDTTHAFTLDAEAPAVGEQEREYVRTTLERRPSRASEFIEALPETRPVVLRILLDNAGHVFVILDLAGVPPGSVMDVFRDTGEYLGRMRLPTPVRVPRSPQSIVAHATPNHLYVVVEDELDVPYVSRLEIVKGQ